MLDHGQQVYLPIIVLSCICEIVILCEIRSGDSMYESLR